jgi:sortase (surface protein transpeptidase)
LQTSSGRRRTGGRPVGIRSGWPPRLAHQIARHADDRRVRRGGWDRRISIALAISASSLLTSAGGTLPGVWLESAEPAVTTTVHSRTDRVPKRESDDHRQRPRHRTARWSADLRPANSGSGPIFGPIRVQSGDPSTVLPQPHNDVPIRLQIPSIDVDLKVEPVGVDSDGSLAMPETTHRVFWYRFGPRPGARSGVTVLVGHIDTFSQGLGPFSRLVSTPSNATVIVTDAAGHKITYVTTHRARVTKKGANLEEVFAPSGPPRLRLVTCAPPYRPSTGYQDLLIVTAVPQ